MGDSSRDKLAGLGPESVKLPNFQMLRELGRGGMGVVYLARQESLQREVAVKVFPAQGVKETNLKRFFREVQLCIALSHPYVVKLLDAGATDEWAWLAMECIDGQPLDSWVRNNGPMRPNQLLAAMEELADALDFVHGHKIVHRDIKPANVMKPKQGSLKLMDFGLARMDSSATLTDEGAVVGSPRYLAPETITNGTMDTVSDLYGLGFLFYEVATATRPYDNRSLRETLAGIVREDLPPPSRLEPSLPAPIDAVIMKLLSKKASDRYQSAKELLEVVRALRLTKDFAGTSWETSRPELNLSFSGPAIPTEPLDPTPKASMGLRLGSRPSRKTGSVLRPTGSFAAAPAADEDRVKRLAVATGVTLAVAGVALGAWLRSGSPGPKPTPLPALSASARVEDGRVLRPVEQVIGSLCASLEGRKLEDVIAQLEVSVGRRPEAPKLSDRPAWAAKATEWLRKKPFYARWRELVPDGQAPAHLTDPTLKLSERRRLYQATQFLLHLDDFVVGGTQRPFGAEPVLRPWTDWQWEPGKSRADGHALCEKVPPGGACVQVHNRPDNDLWYRFVNHERPADETPADMLHAGSDQKVEDSPLPVKDLPGPYSSVTFWALAGYLFRDRYFEVELRPLARTDEETEPRVVLLRAPPDEQKTTGDRMVGVKVAAELAPPGRYEFRIRAFKLTGMEPAMRLRELWAQTRP